MSAGTDFDWSLIRPAVIDIVDTRIKSVLERNRYAIIITCGTVKKL